MVYSLRDSAMLFMASLLLLLGRRMGREELADKHRLLCIGSRLRWGDASHQLVDAID